MTLHKKDQLFSKPITHATSFKFDDSVAPVFADMISRSVPGYTQIINQMSTLTHHFSQDNCNYYDLGCSLGAGMLAMGQSLNHKQACIIGVDNSLAMLNQAQPIIAQAKQQTNIDYQLICADISKIGIVNAAMVAMNFTLQFIAIEQRDQLIQKIHQGLVPNGVLVLSEKIKLESLDQQTLMTNIHHQFKTDQGYSKLEISQKRDAIEHVLLPETLATHSARLKEAGFKIVMPWLQNFQFISLLAVK